MTSTLAEIRALVHDLYPTAIDQLGLVEALRSELKSFESDTLSIHREDLHEVDTPSFRLGRKCSASIAVLGVFKVVLR